MTPTTQKHLRSMVYCVHTNDFAGAKKHVSNVINEKIKARYTAIAQNIDSKEDK